MEQSTKIHTDLLYVTQNGLEAVNELLIIKYTMHEVIR